MYSEKIGTRVYKDGKLDGMKVLYPRYTLYRHVPVIGEECHKMYSIICEYGQGHLNNYVFDNPRTALNCFRLFIDAD